MHVRTASAADDKQVRQPRRPAGSRSGGQFATKAVPDGPPGGESLSLRPAGARPEAVSLVFGSERFEVEWYEDTGLWEPERHSAFMRNLDLCGPDGEPDVRTDTALAAVCEMLNDGDLAAVGQDAPNLCDYAYASAYNASDGSPGARREPYNQFASSEQWADSDWPVWTAAAMRGQARAPGFPERVWESVLDKSFGVAASFATDLRRALFSSEPGVHGPDGLMLARAEESAGQMLAKLDPQRVFAPLLALHLLARADLIDPGQRDRAVSVLATGQNGPDPFAQSLFTDPETPWYEPPSVMVSHETRLAVCVWELTVYSHTGEPKRPWWAEDADTARVFGKAVKAAGRADPRRLGPAARYIEEEASRVHGIVFSD